MHVLEQADTPRSPDWWLVRLGRKLKVRQEKLDLWWNYYTGEQPLPQGPRAQSAAYEDFQRKARTNFCAPVVDASVHRMVVTGVSTAEGESDDSAWSWLQANKFDSRQKQIFRTALAQSESYMMVGPSGKTDKNGKSLPLITIEHPSQVITEDEPSTGDTACALKAWYDSIESRGRALVILPDRIVEYTTGEGPGSQSSLPWAADSWENVTTRPNPYGRVTVVGFPCKPDMACNPEPEFSRVMDLQDRINMGVLNRMTAERYSAFRQKYVTGHKFQKKVDPETGLETVVQPFKPDPGTVWASEYENATFSESAQTNLSGYLQVFQHDVQSLFVLSSTPSYYMPNGLVNVSTDTVLAMDQNHVAKIMEYEATFGEALSEVLQLCALVVGDSRDMSGTQVKWKDPRQLNPSVIADMGVKLASIGYPIAVVAEEMGEPPDRVSKIKKEAHQQMLINQAAQNQVQQAQQPKPVQNQAQQKPQGDSQTQQRQQQSTNARPTTQKKPAPKKPS